MECKELITIVLDFATLDALMAHALISSIDFNFFFYNNIQCCANITFIQEKECIA